MKKIKMFGMIVVGIALSLINSSVVQSQPTSYGDRLQANWELGPNQYIRSSNGMYFLIMQSDGNLVLYKGTQADPQNAIWNSNTQGLGGVRTIMQGDGNLVIYKPTGYQPQDSVWNSGTVGGNGDSVLIVQDDGNLVIYRSGVAVWATNTVQTINLSTNYVIGAAGGPGGGWFDIGNYAGFNRILEVRVWSGKYVDALQLVSMTEDGRTVTSPKVGGAGGGLNVMRLDADERITIVSGRYGRYVDSLAIQTDKGRAMRWGGPGGTAQFVYGGPAQAKLAITGFNGRAGKYIDAIGVFVSPEPKDNDTVARSYFGMSGGTGGSEVQREIPFPNVLVGIRVWSGKYVDAIQLLYQYPGVTGTTLTTEKVGGNGGTERTLWLKPGERVVLITGRAGSYVDSLTIQTTNQTMSWGGSGGSTNFVYQIPPGSNLVGLFGRSGKYVDTFGIQVERR